MSRFKTKQQKAQRFRARTTAISELVGWEPLAGPANVAGAPNLIHYRSKSPDIAVCGEECAGNVAPGDPRVATHRCPGCARRISRYMREDV